MPQRTSRNAMTPGFYADPASIDHNNGRQIDWDAVPNAAPFLDEAGVKFVPAGTAMSELADGKIAPRVSIDVVANPTQTAIGLLASSARFGDHSAARTGYGVVIGGAVFEDLLPDSGDAEWAAIAAELKDAGTGFSFQTYEDSRTA